MSPTEVLDLFREAMYLIVVMVAVVILPSLLVGLAVSVFQAATQINEQTLSFLPRLIVTLITIVYMGPWLLTRLLSFSERVISDIPGYLF